MASSKPRGRPPADGNVIMWTKPLVEVLLRLRFEKYAKPMAASRGTKLLRQAWAEVAAELTQHNNGGVVSVEQCRNKLKALKNKWLAYHAGIASEPVCLALMDVFWAKDKDEAVANRSPHCSRPSPDHRKQVKKPRLTPTSTSTSDAEWKTDVKSLIPIAPAPASASFAAVAPVSTSSRILVETTESVTIAASSPTLTVAAEAGTGIPVTNPVQLLDVGIQTSSQGFTDSASAAGEAARPKDTPTMRNPDLKQLEKLLDDRFTKVLESQEKQLELAEGQNQLLARILATLQRSERHNLHG